MKHSLIAYILTATLCLLQVSQVLAESVSHWEVVKALIDESRQISKEMHAKAKEEKRQVAEEEYQAFNDAQKKLVDYLANIGKNEYINAARDAVLDPAIYTGSKSDQDRYLSALHTSSMFIEYYCYKVDNINDIKVLFDIVKDKEEVFLFRASIIGWISEAYMNKRFEYFARYPEENKDYIIEQMFLLLQDRATPPIIVDRALYAIGDTLTSDIKKAMIENSIAVYGALDADARRALVDKYKQGTLKYNDEWNVYVQAKEQNVGRLLNVYEEILKEKPVGEKLKKRIKRSLHWFTKSICLNQENREKVEMVWNTYLNENGD